MKTEADKFKSNLVKFKEFLEKRSAQLMSPTNEWELLRFRHSKATAVVYHNAKGDLSFVGGAKTAYTAFLGDRIGNPKAWNAGYARKTKPGKSAGRIKSLSEMYGWGCFYCGKDCDQETATVEHLVPLSSGGTDHMNNLALAHGDCNSKAGNMSLMKKIKLRESLIYGN